MANKKPSKTSKTSKTGKATGKAGKAAKQTAAKATKAAKPAKAAKAARPRKARKAGAARPSSDAEKPGTERARDEQRDDGGPRHAGGSWDLADERKPDRDREPERNRETDVEGRRPTADDEPTARGDEDLIDDDRDIEAGGEHEGMGRAAISRGGRGGNGAEPRSRSSE